MFRGSWEGHSRVVFDGSVGFRAMDGLCHFWMNLCCRAKLTVCFTLFFRRKVCSSSGIDRVVALIFSILHHLQRYFVFRVRSYFHYLLCHALISTKTLFWYSKRHTKSHTLCRRCGNRSFHRQHKSTFPTSAMLVGYRFSFLCLHGSLRTMWLPISQDAVIWVGPEGEA